MITSNIHYCQNCKENNTIITDYTNGQIGCTNCGVVINDRIIDETSEWRNFNSENTSGNNIDHNRVGGPLNPYLDEVILSLKVSTKGNRGPLAKFKNRTFESGNRSILRGLEKIEELAIKLELLMSIVDKSKDLYKRIIDNKKLKGRSLDGVIAAIFYHVCRQNGANRSIQEIANRLKINKSELIKCFKSIESFIVTEDDAKDNIEYTKGLTNVYCNKMEIDIKVKSAAISITKEVCEKEILSGKNPSTIASACIIYAHNLFLSNIDKKKLSEVCGIGENTIQNALNTIMSLKDVITPIELKNKISNLH